MKNVLALVLALVMVFALAACGSSAPAATSAPAEQAAPAEEAAPAEAAPAHDPIVLKIGVSTAETDPRNIAAKQFADEIAEKTGGLVTAEVYPAGQLGADGELVNSMAIDAGTADIVITDASNFGTVIADMNISGLPFLFANFEEAWAFMDGPVEAAAEEELLGVGIRVLTHYDNGFRCVTNSNGPIETPDDMKGMKIRTPENQVIMATMEALGANPEPFPFSDLINALRTGQFKAQENPIPVIYNNSLYEVQEFLSVTNHIYSGLCFAIAESTWQKLTAEEQEIVQAAATASGTWERETIKAQTDDLVSSLEEKGMKINYPDLAPFKEATKSVIEQNALGISADLLAQLG